jgi:hypothetical protein
MVALAEGTDRHRHESTSRSLHSVSVDEKILQATASRPQRGCISIRRVSQFGARSGDGGMVMPTLDERNVQPTWSNLWADRHRSCLQPCSPSGSPPPSIIWLAQDSARNRSITRPEHRTQGMPPAKSLRWGGWSFRSLSGVAWRLRAKRHRETEETLSVPHGRARKNGGNSKKKT